MLLFAEPIEKVTGYITRDQMRTLLDIVETTCATDLCCDNFFMRKNLDGEVGIYFIDTEYKTFSFPVSKSSTGYLKELLVPEDHSWFSEEQRHRYPEKQKHPRSIISADEAKQLHRYGFSKNPRTFTFATNTIFSV